MILDFGINYGIEGSGGSYVFGFVDSNLLDGTDDRVEVYIRGGVHFFILCRKINLWEDKVRLCR